MRRVSANIPLWAALLGAGVAGFGCSGTAWTGQDRQPVEVSSVAIEAPADASRPPYHFAAEDERLLDEVQHGAFNYLWTAVAPETGMVRDRTSKPVVSVAGVGFQLSALPIGVERGWVTRAAAEERALLIVRSLAANPNNRRAGLFYHFLDGNNAGQPQEAYERVVSTIDSALLFCGIITAGEYFGGEVKTVGGALVNGADWSFFVAAPGVPMTGPAKDYEQGFMSLAWKPNADSAPTGEGKLVPYFWLDAGDEQKLTVFLANSGTKAEHRVPAEMYYKLRRQLGSHADTGPFAWFPYSGALFTHFFAHCWINYAAVGPDDPQRFTTWPRARVDWWENSRRAIRMHQIKTTARTDLFPGLGENAWGLTASDAQGSYAVPGLFPARIQVKQEQEGRDFSSFRAKDDFGDGTIAPYGAGSAIMFDPGAAVKAMRRFRELKRADGSPLAWRDPGAGGFGFRDSFSIGTEWAAPDCLAIDQGPLIVAIENARTGLIWNLFASNEAIRDGFRRLGMEPPAAAKAPGH